MQSMLIQIGSDRDPVARPCSFAGMTEAEIRVLDTARRVKEEEGFIVCQCEMLGDR